MRKKVFTLGFTKDSEMLKEFEHLPSESVDAQILSLCKRGNYSVNLHTVLQQWKYTLQHSEMKNEQQIFRVFLEGIYSTELIKAMEGMLHYE